MYVCMYVFLLAILFDIKGYNMRLTEIFLAKSTQAPPVYSPEFMKTDEGDTLELNISDTVFLDTSTLLRQLRGTVIDFSKKLKKQEQVEKKLLIRKTKRH